MSQYKHVALIGLGLLAGSISLAMRRAGMDAKITGTARSPCLPTITPVFPSARRRAASDPRRVARFLSADVGVPPRMT